MKYSSDSINFSFYFTYVFLTTTATITFIEAIRTKDNMVRHILNIETVISVIAAFFYNLFITDISKKDSENKPINWNEFTVIRYVDWSITTPFMLLSLCLFLSYNIKKKLNFFIILPIILLNYFMLFIGYLGEINKIDTKTSVYLGFIPFITYYIIIYDKYIKDIDSKLKGQDLLKDESKKKEIKLLYYYFLIFWSIYGIAALLSYTNK